MKPTTKGEPTEAQHGHGLAIPCGKQRPAMSISYEPGRFYLVFNADADLEIRAVSFASQLQVRPEVVSAAHRLSRRLSHE